MCWCYFMLPAHGLLTDNWKASKKPIIVDHHKISGIGVSKCYMIIATSTWIFHLTGSVAGDIEHCCFYCISFWKKFSSQRVKLPTSGWIECSDITTENAIYYTFGRNVYMRLLTWNANWQSHSETKRHERPDCKSMTKDHLWKTKECRISPFTVSEQCRQGVPVVSIYSD